MDRNVAVALTVAGLRASLSARRAWIEIKGGQGGVAEYGTVALRKESVDRNAIRFFIVVALRQSLSARRAWIEMVLSWMVLMVACVALRKESVDRNIALKRINSSAEGRSPQGERG